jgi:NAD(P)-dependent dehydrogenase (short-subunit alcohol dehydrogenase family)
MGRPPERRAGVATADLDGTTALVTGSTSGIGRETALALGRLGADVFVHGRDESAGEQVVDDIEATGADARFVRADYAAVESVRELAATVRESTDQLDLLLNNAGGLFREGRLTDLGVEYTFHVNHLGPYLLTTELLDHVPDDGRIVTTASEAHRGASLDHDAVTSVDAYSGLAAYNRSKLANILFTRELDRRCTAAGRDLTVSAVHPGAIPGSNFSRFLPGPVASGMKVLDGVPFITSVEDGAAALLYAAVAPDTAGVSGRYFAKQRSKTPSRAARDPNAARELWVRSADLLDVEEPLAEAVRTA